MTARPTRAIQVARSIDDSDEETLSILNASNKLSAFGAGCTAINVDPSADKVNPAEPSFDEPSHFNCLHQSNFRLVLSADPASLASGNEPHSPSLFEQSDCPSSTSPSLPCGVVAARSPDHPCSTGSSKGSGRHICGGAGQFRSSPAVLGAFYSSRQIKVIVLSALVSWHTCVGSSS